jgi:hypothetical protein
VNHSAPLEDFTLDAKLESICAKWEQKTEDPVSARLRTLALEVHRPLRVAVIGRVDAGKSTLVNALIHRKLAPTGNSETTKCVTRFRFDKNEVARLQLKSGKDRKIPWDAREKLPDTLGVESQDVSFVDVTLSLDVLKRVTVIDTPGLDSIHLNVSAKTADFVKATEVDAVIYVFTGTVLDVDRQVLHDFRVASTSLLGKQSCNVLGVLSRADQMAPGIGLDPWPEAHLLARDNTRQLGRDIGTVVPIIGLLAETANTGFKEDYATAIRAISDYEFTTIGDFMNVPAPVSERTRRELVDLLQLYGLRHLVGAARSGFSAEKMRDMLVHVSNFSTLERAMQHRFVDRRLALKAVRVVAELEYFARDMSVANRKDLMQDLEGIRTDQAMHDLAEIHALNLIATGDTGLSKEQSEEAVRLLTEREPSLQLGLEGMKVQDLLGAALSMADRWDKVRNSPTHHLRRETARIVFGSVEILRQKLERQLLEVQIDV